MGSLPIQANPVTTRKQQQQFMQFAWDHYAGDPNWVPPLRMHQKEMLNFKPHPFYENAVIQSFLAMRGNKMVGRIAAVIDHGHNLQHKEKRGMFGFFESIEDQAVANALFDAATDWMRKPGDDVCSRAAESGNESRVRIADRGI